MSDHGEKFDAEAVRNMVIPHKTRLDRRKAVYGTYHFTGRAKDRLSWLQTGARVEYTTEERDGRHLEVVAHAEDRIGKGLPNTWAIEESAVGVVARGTPTIEVRVSIVGSPDGEVEITTEGEGELGLVAVLYATGLAMTWEWTRALVVRLPATVSRRASHALSTRRSLRRVGRVEHVGAARTLRFAVVSPQSHAKS